MKYYAVRKGKKPGIYNTWDEAKQQVEGFSGAVYKSFGKQKEAQEFLQSQTKKKTSRPEIVVFTDGGSRNHGNVAGGHVRKNDKAAWAYLVDYKKQQHDDTGGELGATNNRMEIMALIKALQWLCDNQLNDKQIGVVSDSKYVLNAINKHWLAGWQKRGYKKASGELKNRELWRTLYELLQHFPNIEFGWTKGHENNAGNVFVDKLLNQTMDKLKN